MVNTVSARMIFVSELAPAIVSFSGEAGFLRASALMTVCFNNLRIYILVGDWTLKGTEINSID